MRANQRVGIRISKERLVSSGFAFVDMKKHGECPKDEFMEHSDFLNEKSRIPLINFVARSYRPHFKISSNLLTVSLAHSSLEALSSRCTAPKEICYP